MQTYMSIAQAFEKCQSAMETVSYENHLWAAFEEALQKPLDNARDLIVVVDGLDELQVEKAAAQAFFERLAETTSDGKRVKLIAFAQSLSMPSGLNTTHISLTAEQLRDDLHAVALRNLMHCRSFTTKAGPEQEQVRRCFRDPREIESSKLTFVSTDIEQIAARLGQLLCLDRPGNAVDCELDIARGVWESRGQRYKLKGRRAGAGATTRLSTGIPVDDQNRFGVDSERGAAVGCHRR